MDHRSVTTSACGRVVLLGEHSDWAGRYCILSSIDKHITGTSKPRDDRQLVVSSKIEGTVYHGRYDLDGLSKCHFGEETDVLMYFPAVARVMIDRGLSIGGLEIECVTGLPVKKGLASSAAVCILLVRSFRAMYNLDLVNTDIIDISYEAENLLGIRCGKMDQASIIYHHHPVFIDFRVDPFTIEHIVPASRFHFVVGDCLGTKDTARILENLSNALFKKSETDKDKKYHLASRYFWEVLPDLVLKGRKSLQDGDVERFGGIMKEAQKLYDEFMYPLSPSELAAPKMHEFLNIVRVEGSVGEKWSGSGGDGAFLSLAVNEEHQQHLIRIIRERGGDASELNL